MWGRWQVGAITRLDVQTWIEVQKKAGVGPDTIIGSYYLLSAILAILRDATLQTPPVIPVSPCQHIDLPKTTKKRAKVYTDRQLDGILAEVDFQSRVMLELDSYTGLRWGELAGIHDDQIDWCDDEHGDGHDLAGGCKVVICRVATRKGIRSGPSRWSPTGGCPCPGTCVMTCGR